MYTSSTNHQHPQTTNVILSEDEIYLGIINKWLHLFFNDNYPDSAVITPDAIQSKLYHFINSAESLLRNNTHKTHTMLVFDCKATGVTTDATVADNLTTYLEEFLLRHIHTPNLFCRLCDNSFVVLLEDCKEIDIAVLVIFLMEEVSGLDPDKKAKLTFGTCKADKKEQNIHSLYQKATYAMRSIEVHSPQILADYHEIITRMAVKG